MSEETFKNLVVANLSQQLIKHIDKLVISKQLRYTQKLIISNMKESGLIDAIMLGNFKKITLDELIDLFAMFDVGISIQPLNKELYDSSILSVH